MGKKENTIIRTVLFLGILGLASTFVLPLWDIAIFAPQYPEGLSLTIWLHKIGGDLQNINILNHYVGMKVIAPSDIKELIYFPKIVGGLLGLGCVALLIPRIWSLGAYFLTYSGFAIFSMYDFWKWEYEYGHQLSPDAPIKVPGMSYQPPLFGTEQLLNITVYSYPAAGGWLMIMSYTMLTVLFLAKFKSMFLKKS